MTNVERRPVNTRAAGLVGRRRIAGRLISVALLSSILLLALGCVGGATGEVPELESRAQQLNKTIMCPVCPGESIDQSQNALAVQMRGIVSEKLEAGWSDQQVREFFVERYGPSVLLEPPRRGIDIVAWVLPPVAILIAGVVLVLVLKWMATPDSAQAEAHGPALTTEERTQYVRRIEAALDLDSDPPEESPTT